MGKAKSEPDSHIGAQWWDKNQRHKLKCGKSYLNTTKKAFLLWVVEHRSRLSWIKPSNKQIHSSVNPGDSQSPVGCRSEHLALSSRFGLGDLQSSFHPQWFREADELHEIELCCVNWSFLQPTLSSVSCQRLLVTYLEYSFLSTSVFIPFHLSWQIFKISWL